MLPEETADSGFLSHGCFYLHGGKKVLMVCREAGGGSPTVEQMRTIEIHRGRGRGTIRPQFREKSISTLIDLFLTYLSRSELWNGFIQRS